MQAINHTITSHKLGKYLKLRTAQVCKPFDTQTQAIAHTFIKDLFSNKCKPLITQLQAINFGKYLKVYISTGMQAI